MFVKATINFSQFQRFFHPLLSVFRAKLPVRHAQGPFAIWIGVQVVVVPCIVLVVPTKFALVPGTVRTGCVTFLVKLIKNRTVGSCVVLVVETSAFIKFFVHFPCTAILQAVTRHRLFFSFVLFFSVVLPAAVLTHLVSHYFFALPSSAASGSVKVHSFVPVRWKQLL